MKPTTDQIEAAKRLWKIANGNSGQCEVVARFLLGLYNGYRFKFDLTDFRRLDTAIFQDCLNVLVMDYQPQDEIHEALGIPGAEFERLAKEWNVKEAPTSDQ
ncbi:hypothetical protein [Geotalea sp. SG265]|uniref:DUF7673 family protein n=1 Tax=Geotalea sp. SG265 TaxID=2922867 RepID=UPI001FAEE2F8|nr:hypothetical protein [Geotalea sp. SG265]